MGVFNNLVMFDPQVKQNSLGSIVPDLATGWSWNEEGTELTFPLRQGVKWHDGNPFTAADVKCTWDLLMDRASEKLRVNPRKSAYANVAQVSTNGDYEVTFRLKRPQPAFFSQAGLAKCRCFVSGRLLHDPSHDNPMEPRAVPVAQTMSKFGFEVEPV